MMRRLPIWLVPVVLVPAVLSVPALLGRVLLFRDVHFNLPQHAFAAAALAAGRLPEWNPQIYGGVPFFAEPGSGALYPPNLLFLLLPPAAAETAFALAHLPLAAVGAFLLARVLGLSREAAALAALGYGASGYVLSMHSGHYYLASAAWLPLVIALLLRAGERPSPGSLLGAAAAVAATALNGDLQGTAFACGIALLLAPLGHGPRLRRLGIAAALCAAGGALAAVQLVPTWLATQDTIRAAGLPLAHAASWSLHPARWIELLVPQPFGLPYPDNAYWGAPWLDHRKLPWAPSLYLGPAILLPAALALGRDLPARLRALAVLVPLALVLAAGTHLPVFALWFEWVPLAGKFRTPEKYAIVATLALAVLAGAGLDVRLRRPVVAAVASLAVAVVLGAFAALVAAEPGWLVTTVGRGLQASSAIVEPPDAIASSATALLRAAGVALAVGAAAWLARTRKELLVPVALVVAGVDLAAAGLRTLSWADGSFLGTEPPLAEAVRAAAPPGSAGRYFRDPACRFPGGGEGTLLERVREWEWWTGKENYLALAGLDAAIGYGPAEPTERLRTFNGVVGAGGLEPALRLFGTAAVIRCAGRAAVVEPLASPLPRAAVLPWELATDPLPRVSAPGFDPARLAVVEEPVEAPSGEPAPAIVEQLAPEHVVVRADGGGGVLVLADGFADGWTATRDGAPARIVRVDGIWRGVAVPAGPVEVVFRYRTPGLRAGAAISALAAAAVALAAFLAGRRRHA